MMDAAEIEPRSRSRSLVPPQRKPGSRTSSAYATNGMSVDDLLPSESTAITWIL